MGRRKSTVSPGAGSFDKKAEKKRNPFAPFKRTDSSREMQIPESPPSTADRPGTALTEDDSPQNLSVSQDHYASDIVAPVPVAQSMPTTTNGTSLENQSRITSNGTTQVRGDSRSQCTHFADLHLQFPVDSEGFTERPSTVDEITRAQREAAGYAIVLSSKETGR